MNPTTGSVATSDQTPPRPVQFLHASGDRPLDGYTIKRGIGWGGFGEVYYAVSDGGKEVALKLIQRHLDVELRGVSQCLNLKHPNLVLLYDVRQSDRGDCWVVMEYMAGQSLSDVLATNPAGLPRQQVAQWLSGICDGVGYLHDHGIVHRDLKPGNIFIENEIVKIGDYGLAKFISASRRSGQTDSVGTVHYMAPEIAQGRYGKEIDLYALGIIVYEMLTGRVPFDGQSPAEILMKHLTAQPDTSALPEPFRSAVGRLLAKDPRERYPSVQALLIDLDRIAAVEPRAFVPPPLPPQPPPASPAVALEVPAAVSHESKSHAASPLPYIGAPAPTVPQPTRTLDIGRCFNDAMSVYTRNWLVLAVAAFLYELLSAVTLFILCGPLSGGVCVMTLNAMNRPDKSVQLGDLFAGFNRFGRLLGMFWLTLIPVLIGFALCIFPGLLLATIWLFPSYLIVDKNLGVFRSLGTSQQIVSRKGFGLNLLLALIVFVLAMAPGAIPWIGFVLGWFVVPIGWLMETSAYIQQVREDQGELADLLGPGGTM